MIVERPIRYPNCAVDSSRSKQANLPKETKEKVRGQYQIEFAYILFLWLLLLNIVFCLFYSIYE